MINRNFLYWLTILSYLIISPPASSDIGDTNDGEAIEELKPQFKQIAEPQQENFGRLFTTPAQRRYLDDRRQVKQSNNHDSGDTLVSAVQQDQNHSKPEVRLSGVLLRDDGKHMVWINGRSELSPTNTTSSETDKARASKPRSGSISVSVHSQQRSARLKPGQVWLLDEKRVDEAYQLKSISSSEKSVTETEQTPEKDTVSEDDGET